MMWVKERPTSVGKYWCHQNRHSRIVTVWKYSNNGKLFTYGDGGYSLSDHIYDDALWWSEEIKPPTNPDLSNINPKEGETRHANGRQRI
ncbi:hypothetical protein HN385_07850 [archaeon]|jgi:hypothetical protein|nr:hypothetical protein [archaeon]